MYEDTMTTLSNAHTTPTSDVDLSVSDLSDGVFVTASTLAQADNGVEVTIPPRNKAAATYIMSKNNGHQPHFYSLPGVLETGPGVGQAGFERSGF